MNPQGKKRHLPPGAMLIAITVVSIVITFLGLATLLARMVIS